MPEKTLKTTDIGDFGLKIFGSFEALLCSSVYRLYYEAIQYLKIDFIFFNIDYSEWPLN